ncbi:MAG: TVP38/TMEM64 family protein [Betaproteobacteria bacterium]
MITFDKKSLTGIIIFCAVVIGLLYLLFPLGLARYFTDKKLLMHIIQEHRAYAALIFIGLQALQVVAAPVPGEVTGFVGGIIFGAVWGVIYSTVGLTIGSWLAFALARLAGRPLVEKVVNPETIQRYDYVMKHKGLFLAFLMFLIPGFPKDILCFVLGLGHMGQRDFLVVSTTGRLLGTVLLTIEGSFFRQKRYGAFFTVLGISIVVILLVMIYRETIERWFRRIRAAQRLKSRSDRCKPKNGDGG